MGKNVPGGGNSLCKGLEKISLLILKPNSIGILKKGDAKPVGYSFQFQFIFPYTTFFSPTTRYVVFLVCDNPSGWQGRHSCKAWCNRRTLGLVRSLGF